MQEQGIQCVYRVCVCTCVMCIMCVCVHVLGRSVGQLSSMYVHMCLRVCNEVCVRVYYGVRDVYWGYDLKVSNVCMDTIIIESVD